MPALLSTLPPVEPVVRLLARQPLVRDTASLARDPFYGKAPLVFRLLNTQDSANLPVVSTSEPLFDKKIVKKA
jgi:hypothetical protein